MLLPGIVYGQHVNRPQIDVEDMIGRLASLSTEDLDYEEIYENLYALLQNPIDINRAERDDFMALFFLTERQINNLMNHRIQFGDFLSLYELQSLETFSLDDIQNLLPFVSINLAPLTFKPGDMLKRSTEHYLVLRAGQTLERSRGYKEEIFAGSPQQYYTRYRMSRSKDFSLGFISEKDPGEKNFFDYTAFHAQVQNKGRFKNILVGDYLLQFGQGLVFSAGYVAGKGGEPVYTTRRSNLGARPYNSLIENGSFRGATATYQEGNLEITAMVSHRKKDASVSDPTETEEEFFGSLLTAGLHRTESEIKNRRAVTEQNVGGNILYRLDHIQFGFSVLNTRFDKSFERRPLSYNYYDFSGTSNLIMGPNLSILVENFNIFAEAARSSSGGYGYLVGLVGSLGKNVEWAFNHRNYQSNFHTLYGNAFSENSRTINEKGVYTGLRYIIKRGIEVVAYYDYFAFPWLKFRVDAPSYGHEYQLRLNYRPNKQVSSYLAFKGETKPRNLSADKAVQREPIDAERRTLVASLDYDPTMFLKLQTKAQLNSFDQLGSDRSLGWMLMQDIEFKIKRVQIKTRVAYFDTDTYDSRVYAYENDVLYAISFPAYSGKGLRYYFLTKLPISRNIEAWFRIAQTRLNDEIGFSSGYNQIEGRYKTDAKVQLKFKF